MRNHTILWLVAAAGTALAVGCGANEVDMGQGGANPTPTPTATATPTPSATPGPTPSAASFTAVQASLESVRANCGQATCHVPPAGTGPFALYTAAGTAQVDVDKNRVVLSCLPNIDDYSPTGLVVQTFCAAGGTALASPQHEGRTTLVNADCAALFTWLQTGVDPPAPCP
jgi:hypothetical protein